MKASLLMLMLLCVCAAILASLTVFSQRKSSRDQRSGFADMELKAVQLQDQVTELLKDQARMSEELRAMASAAKTAQNTATNFPADKKPATPYQQAFFAKAFLGDEYVGLAKVTPVFRTDKKSGETVFENIITLSGDARNSLTKTVTNFVEREVVRNTTLNNNYSSRQPYWYAYPAWVRPGNTNGTPNRPNPMPPIARPTIPNSGSGQWKASDGSQMWQNGKPWVPKTIK